MSLLLALTGSTPQTITASGLSNPFATGSATIVLTIGASGIAQAQASGTSSLSLSISASGIALPASFGRASLTGGADVAPEESSGGIWFAGWDWRDTERSNFRPRTQRVSCRGIAQHVGLGNSRLSQRIGSRGIGHGAGTGTVKVSLTVAARGLRVYSSTAPRSRLLLAMPRSVRAVGLRVSAKAGSPRIESVNPDFAEEVAMILSIL